MATSLTTPVAACQPALVGVLLPRRLQHCSEAPVLRELLLAGHMPGVLAVLRGKGVHCCLIIIPSLLLHGLPAQGLDLLQEHVLTQDQILLRAPTLRTAAAAAHAQAQQRAAQQGNTDT